MPPPTGPERASVVGDLLSLVLPQECAGCGERDRAICPRCRAQLGEPARCEQLTAHLSGVGTGAGLPTWALARYDGAVRHLVLAWKSGGRPDLTAPLTAAFDHAAAGLPDRGLSMPPRRELVVVPAPSAAARRRAGRFVVGDLADAAGRGIAAACGRRVLVADVLRRSAGAGHELGAAARRQDRGRAVRSLTPLPAGSVCVLVDDVVTTGATLAASAGALRSSGAQVLGALVLAVTPPPGSVGMPGG